jgi:hypothetical protein
MKNKITKLTKVLFASAALLVGMAAFTPTTALAAEHGGHGFSGGRSGGFGGGHSFSGGGSYGGRGNYAGRGYEGGRGYYGGRGYGGFYGGGRYFGGRKYIAPRYYGGGFGLGFYAGPSYRYAAPVCNPSGFYDQGGYWHYYPGCAAAPYGY